MAAARSRICFNIIISGLSFKCGFPFFRWSLADEGASQSISTNYSEACSNFLLLFTLLLFTLTSLR
jgi:hypothetical protein